MREDVGLYSDSGRNSTLGNVPTQVAVFICVHYIVRKCVEAVSLFNLSLAVFRSYFLNIWTAVDVMSILLTLTAISYNESHPDDFRNGFNAFVVGLLWLKVLGFLKVANRHMSTFIMAVFQILLDLKYFAVVLIVVVCQMGDMMSIAVGTKDNGSFCEENEEQDSTVEDFCSDNRTDGYLRVYALLLGEFDLDSYRETKGLAILFVIFTVVGVIILLNVLIAVISDSYERARLRGPRLFGTARVTFVAQHEALEGFLRPGSNPLDSMYIDSPRKAVICCVHVFRWLVLLTLIATATHAEVFLVSRAVLAMEIGGNPDVFYLLLSVILALILTVALWIVVVFVLEKAVQRYAPRPISQIFDLCNKCSLYAVKLVAGRIFGVRQTVDVPLKGQDEGNDGEEWNGRIDHIEHMLENALIRSSENVRDEIHRLEKRLAEQQVLVNNGQPF